MDSDRLAGALATSVKGEVRFDHVSRVLYSTDASIYEIVPIGVVLPRDAEDIAATLRVCAEEGVPVLPRGAGTSLAGQSVGRAVILDCSKYMNEILEIDPGRGQARVQPGVVQDVLNGALAPHRLRLGPDTATSNRATLGGMIGNNSAGARSIVYGKMVDHVLGLRVLLYDGTEIALGALDDDALAVRRGQPSREGRLYRTVLDTVEANLELGFPADAREWGIGNQILADLGLTTIRILTNNPKKLIGLDGFGLTVVEQVPIEVEPQPENARYLAAKREKLGHTIMKLHHQGVRLEPEPDPDDDE